MANKLETRIRHKHDTEQNWQKAINFVPLAAELIIYDADASYSFPRIKVGNGETPVNDLPFIGNNVFEIIKELGFDGTEKEFYEYLASIKEISGGALDYIIELNKGEEQKFWRGTQAEYDAIEEKDEKVFYIITDSEPVDVGALGDMKAEIYDPEGKATDIFAYVDDKIAEIPTPDVGEQIGEHNSAEDAHEDIRELIAELSDKLNAVANSDDETLDQLAEIVEYIKENRELIELGTGGSVNIDIVDNLITDDPEKALSAAQGVVLKGLIDELSKWADEHTHDFIIEQNEGNEQKFWSGTRAEYDAIEVKDDNTIYMVTGDKVASSGGSGGGYVYFTKEEEIAPEERKAGTLYGLILADYREVE